ncbi:alpha/beta-hydrolase [Mollisia scopiformis]|uniref:Carboxylic ester hydrolase n=1 Tax=Mollisia scopiformis TaxID=149040 RepID=A0A194XBW3_MOLSC|nr:alpha/beta-hydrolase [Mollisia scopiformis]KUJ17654.1 alpha/beta-hydrolase [Mollisia scopiformis]
MVSPDTPFLDCQLESGVVKSRSNRTKITRPALDLCSWILTILAIALVAVITLGTFLKVQHNATWKLGSTQKNLEELLSESSASPIAKSRNGSYVGIHNAKYFQDYFLGIPYAQPPLGSLRFLPPAFINTTWEGTMNATDFGPQCVGYYDGDMHTPRPFDEDCLTVNVFRPHLQGLKKKLPVVVWIYGGAYEHGGSNDQRFNLTWIVAQSIAIGKPIIAVTLNYRSSIFGFMSSSQVIGARNTNVGLRDQRLALHWVQENIEGFGGDKDKVTLWGASSGAENVGIHLTAYGGRDDHLFRAVIMTSGSPATTSLGSHTPSAQDAYDKLLYLTDCRQTSDPFVCLQSLPFEELNAVFNNSRGFDASYMGAFTHPVVDGDFIRGFGSLEIKANHFVKVPILSTITSNEGGGYTPKGLDSLEGVKAFLIEERNLPLNVAGQLTELYLPLSTGEIELSTPRRSNTPFVQPSWAGETDKDEMGRFFTEAAYILGDMENVAPHRLTCDAFSKFSATYCGRFDAIPYGWDPRRGATHAADLAVMFHNTLCTGFEPCPFQSKSPAYFRLSDLMSSMIISFISDVDPNVGIPRLWNASKWEKHMFDVPLDFVLSEDQPCAMETKPLRVEGMEYIKSILSSILGK